MQQVSQSWKNKLSPGVYCDMLLKSTAAKYTLDSGVRRKSVHENNMVMYEATES